MILCIFYVNIHIIIHFAKSEVFYTCKTFLFTFWFVFAFAVSGKYGLYRKVSIQNDTLHIHTSYVESQKGGMAVQSLWR